MAKTLIGNIKGKDGRGISKIEKTSTTGVVDTYTITYTDGTTSTYEVRNADVVAVQRQIVPSAAVESSTTASQAYTAGDYVVVGGVLRKVTSSITKGSTIGDSNSTATTATGEIKAVRDSVSQTKNLYSARNWQVDLRAGIVFVTAKGVNTGTGSWDYTACPYNLPEEYRPESSVFMPVMTTNGGSVTGLLVVDPDGTIKVSNNGGSGSDGGRYSTLAYPL